MQNKKSAFLCIFGLESIIVHLEVLVLNPTQLFEGIYMRSVILNKHGS